MNDDNIRVAAGGTIIYEPKKTTDPPEPKRAPVEPAPENTKTLPQQAPQENVLLQEFLRKGIRLMGIIEEYYQQSRPVEQAPVLAETTPVDEIHAELKGQILTQLRTGPHTAEQLAMALQEEDQLLTKLLTGMQQEGIVVSQVWGSRFMWALDEEFEETLNAT